MIGRGKITLNEEFLTEQNKLLLNILSKYNVPIISCFVKIEDTDEYEENGFKKSKYTLYIMDPIYPDPSKDLRQNKDEMRKKDYEQKIQAYEQAYGKKLDYTFIPEEDIAGW